MSSASVIPQALSSLMVNFLNRRFEEGTSVVAGPLGQHFSSPPASSAQAAFAPRVNATSPFRSGDETDCGDPDQQWMAESTDWAHTQSAPATTASYSRLGIIMACAGPPQHNTSRPRKPQAN
jgi:hypothetical protein